MSAATTLLVGTRKGAFLVTRATDPGWTIQGPLCEGWPIHDMIEDAASGAILAAGASPWYGPAVWRSEDGGGSWTHSSEGLTYGTEGRPSPPCGAWPLPTA